jgi:hypothetical protein
VVVQRHTSRPAPGSARRDASRSACSTALTYAQRPPVSAHPCRCTRSSIWPMSKPWRSDEPRELP